MKILTVITQGFCIFIIIVGIYVLYQTGRDIWLEYKRDLIDTTEPENTEEKEPMHIDVKG